MLIGDANIALVVVRRSQKKFRPAADPLRRGAGPPKFSHLEVTTSHLQSTDPV